MAFDKKHYTSIKRFVAYQLRHIPSYTNDVDIVSWVIGYINLIPGCVEREDFEAAKAFRDAVHDLFDEIGVPYDKDRPFKFKENLGKEEISAIICYGTDHAGLTGYAEIIKI